MKRDVRHAFTLNETVVSLIAASTLMLGMGSTVYLVARTSTTAGRPAPTVIVNSHALNDLAAELHYASAITERTAHAVTFTLADRTGDGMAETVRYAWSGTAGDPLIRTYNGVAKVVHEEVDEFDLNYVIQTVLETTEEQSPGAPVTGSEVLAASFNGWSGVTATTMTRALNAGVWASEYFELAWPAGATSFQVTRIRLKLGQSVTTGQFTVGIYAAAGGVGPLPSTTLLGSQQTLSTSGLPVTPDWKELTFSGVTMTDNTSGYNILVKGVTAGGKLTYLYAATAPQDAMVHKYSTNSGSTWSPAASSEKVNDVPFEVYGVFTISPTETQPETIERYFVRAVGIELQSSENSAPSVKTTIDILNSPEVATP
jgi:hypothetical protein